MGRVIKKTPETASGKTALEGGDPAADALAHSASLIRMRARIEDELRGDVVDLALLCARRIVGQAVELDPSTLDGIYGQALAAAGDAGSLVIHVHPGDRARSDVDAMAAARGVRVAEDPSVGPAGCKVTVGSVEVRATLDGALAALRKAMMGGDRG
ncbi:MAG: FliH/SctL family protein [Deltaproteobacteria bacterium]|nr:FliH/SctL family protein [Deltaproteobacteria bacterium]